MMSEIYFLKEERRCYIASKNEAFQEYLKAKSEVDEAEKNREYALSQKNMADQEYLEIKKRFDATPASKTLKKELSVAFEIQKLQEQRLKEADNQKKKALLEKQVCWEIFSYYQWEVQRLSQLLSAAYKEQRKKTPKKRKYYMHQSQSNS
jgi:hypothetical protein